jgi:hypothetical protein
MMLMAHPHDLNEERPDYVLGKGCVALLALSNVVREISALRILHDDAQPVSVKESLVVADDIGVLHTRKQPDLVCCVLAFLLIHLSHIGLLHGIRLLVIKAHHTVDRPVAPLAQELLDLHSICLY